jgi:hypothetical protein
MMLSSRVTLYWWKMVIEMPSHNATRPLPLTRRPLFRLSILIACALALLFVLLRDTKSPAKIALDRPTGELLLVQAVFRRVFDLLRACRTSWSKRPRTTCCKHKQTHALASTQARSTDSVSRALLCRHRMEKLWGIWGVQHIALFVTAFNIPGNCDIVRWVVDWGLRWNSNFCSVTGTLLSWCGLDL